MTELSKREQLKRLRAHSARMWAILATSGAKVTPINKRITRPVQEVYYDIV